MLYGTLIGMHVALALLSGFMGILLLAKKTYSKRGLNWFLWVSTAVILTGCIAAVSNTTLSAAALVPHALMYSGGIFFVVWWRTHGATMHTITAHGYAMGCLLVLAAAQV